MPVQVQTIESEESRSKYEAIYKEYRFLMFSAANSILKNPYDAEDAVHQAIIAIIDNMDKIGAIDCPETKSYVITIAKHKAIDMLRSRKRLSLEELIDAFPGKDISFPEDRSLIDSMARLPERYREILLLRFYDGYSTKELARMMHMNTGSMQKLIWRAKGALRKQLDIDGES